MNKFETNASFSIQPNGKKVPDGVFSPSMPYFKFQDTRLQLALPRGELEVSVKQFMREIGLIFPENGSTFEIAVENMPVDFVFLRASDIPRTVLDERSQTKAGITGSDIVWEQARNLGTKADAGETLPIDKLVPSAPTSRLFIGITERFAQQIIERKERLPNKTDLIGQTIVTKYPNITEEFTTANDIKDVDIYEVAGTDEAYQYAFPNMNGILGIINTGKTIEANNITILEEFYAVSVRIIQYGYDKLTTRDMQILRDLQEMTWLALKNRGMV